MKNGKRTAKEVADWLAAIAEPTRVRVVLLLAKGPQTVGALAEAVGVPTVNMSHHLGVLRNGGVVANDKKGRSVEYRLAGGDGLQLGGAVSLLLSPKEIVG